MNWGGSGIERVVFDFIIQNVPIGSVAIELGAGHVSTKALCVPYVLYSVEHDEKYIGHYASTYIHAPIVNDWYDRSKLIRMLPRKIDQKLILIDGINRRGILNNLDLFNRNALYIIHDTYRKEESDLALELAGALGRDYILHTNGDYWASI